MRVTTEASSRDLSTKTKVAAGVGVGALVAGTVAAAAYVALTGGSGAAAATTTYVSSVFMLFVIVLFKGRMPTSSYTAALLRLLSFSTAPHQQPFHSTFYLPLPFSQ